MKKVITISREFGSGGRSIGREAAERLGWAFYDRALVERLAKESGYSEEFIEKRGEDATTTSSFLFNLVRSAPTGAGYGAGGGNFENTPGGLSDQLFIMEYKLIKALPDEGPCVIVGRCSDYILRDRVDALHVFVFADDAFRADRIVRLYGEREDAPLKRLEEKDKRRKVFYKNYTGRSWGRYQNYDLCLNSGKLGVSECADLIVRLAQG